MKTLTKIEWIAVSIAIAVVVVFLGSKFFTSSESVATKNIDMTNQLRAIEQDVNQEIATTTATSTINQKDKMNTSNQQTASNGLIIKDTVVGMGAEAKNGNMVAVHYIGKLADGSVFDSSISRGQPIEFVLGSGMVIKGWDQGILGMKVGSKRTLTIPGALGYGAQGHPPEIPANATLYFDVELVGVKVK